MTSNQYLELLGSLKAVCTCEGENKATEDHPLCLFCDARLQIEAMSRTIELLSKRPTQTETPAPTAPTSNPQSRSGLNLVSGLTKLGNAEGESWVTLTEAESAAVCAELSKLHAEHLQDVNRMERAVETIERLELLSKRPTQPETPAHPPYRTVSNEDRILTLQELKNAWAHVQGDEGAQADVAGHIRASRAALASRPETSVPHKPNCAYTVASLRCDCGAVKTGAAETAKSHIDAFLTMALPRIADLMQADPEDATPEGRELMLLADLADRYERQKYPEFSGRPVKPHRSGGGGPPAPEAPVAQFLECDTCRAKPGSPTLCAGCLNNRNAIADLKDMLSMPPRARSTDIPGAITHVALVDNPPDPACRVSGDQS